MYNKVTLEDIALLKTICGETEVLCGEQINPDYAHDELGGVSRMPEVLVRVHSTEEISKVMRHAPFPSPSGAAAPAWWARRCPLRAVS